MAATESSLLRHFPLLLPQNRAKTVYEGFISAQVPARVALSGKHAALGVALSQASGSEWSREVRERPPSGAVALPALRLRGVGGAEGVEWAGWSQCIFQLLCSQQLRNVLNEYHQIVQQRMQQSLDLMSFMMELKMILEVALKNKQEFCVQPLPPKFCASLLEEIGALGWDKLVYVDNCFSTIKLKAEDASGREHLITVKLEAKRLIM
ncbi:E3 ubiquitin-protein ligase FANCL-like [Nannospalax galili]|uniref:E3 ubiquitin-protein ligase FANCL-like n=1 Tax=Nannospalax galili TaxID=1026970 RepID=UPI00111BE3AA|nr:E3 ubiquitin-protein ligase FANCL-like [Nannospalax galili]